LSKRKIEDNLPYKSKKPNPPPPVPQRSDGVGARRKEINLSELKKALEESLENKEKQVSRNNEEVNVGVQDIISEKKFVSSSESRETEKNENPKETTQKNEQKEKENDKKEGIINPGQKIKL
jgi:hypothetical protein